MKKVYFIWDGKRKKFTNKYHVDIIIDGLHVSGKSDISQKDAIEKVFIGVIKYLKGLPVKISEFGYDLASKKNKIKLDKIRHGKKYDRKN